LRVLCFRRAEVAKLNTAIRRSVYGRDADPYLPGERLITVEAVKDPFDAEGFPLYGSSRELVVQQATTGELLHPTCSDGKPFLCWHLTVLADGPEEFPKRITVIDPRHEGKLAVALTDLKAEAKEHPDAQGAWDPYWELRDTFAEVQPHWAMTVHKSQGSQFRHVFISPDLDTAPGAKSMRRHLWYTALTRAQQAVHLIADTEIQA
jgi:exodeoxyribonuclease-5